MTSEARAGELGETAGLIREHLWRGGVPKSPDSRPWTMARELSIVKLLVRAGFSHSDIDNAITAVRELRPDWSAEPLSMRVFYWRSADGFTSTPFLETCIGYHHNRRRKDRRSRRMLPDSTRQVLRRMLDG